MTVTTLTMGSWGEIKTCKTTLGLTFPTPWVLFNFDLSFARASNRLSSLQSGKTLVEVPMGTPLTSTILASADMIIKTYQLPIKFPKAIIKGYSNLWEDQILPDLTMTMLEPRIASMLLDTGTVMWNVAKDAQLEKAQYSKTDRISLLPVEYSTPNGQMRAVLGSAQHYGKNLYIPHHVGGKYESRLTGDSIRVGDTWDGWNHLGAIMDLIVKTDLEPGPMIVGQMVPTRIPFVTIETSGYSLGFEGQKIRTPTFELLLAGLNAQMAVEAL